MNVIVSVFKYNFRSIFYKTAYRSCYTADPTAVPEKLICKIRIYPYGAICLVFSSLYFFISTNSPPK